VSDEAAQVDCPTCGTSIVLLPLKRYAGAENVDPEDVFDVVVHSRDSMFAIVDAEGFYTCPQCGAGHRVVHDDLDDSSRSA
jgi:predicted RNA-binding Zn-ribbon protein involved in translation (DUF1610 family)